MVRAFCFLTVAIVGDMFLSKWLGFLGGLGLWDLEVQRYIFNPLITFFFFKL